MASATHAAAALACRALAAPHRTAASGSPSHRRRLLPFCDAAPHLAARAPHPHRLPPPPLRASFSEATARGRHLEVPIPGGHELRPACSSMRRASRPAPPRGTSPRPRARAKAVHDRRLQLERSPPTSAARGGTWRGSASPPRTSAYDWSALRLHGAAARAGAAAAARARRLRRRTALQSALSARDTDATDAARRTERSRGGTCRGRRMRRSSITQRGGVTATSRTGILRASRTSTGRRAPHAAAAPRPRAARSAAPRHALSAPQASRRPPRPRGSPMRPLHQQHKPSEYACFLKQRGFEAGASYSGGTASGIVEK